MWHICACIDDAEDLIYLHITKSHKHEKSWDNFNENNFQWNKIIQCVLPEREHTYQSNFLEK